MYLAVRLLVAWGVNVLALIVADWVFSGFTIERWGSLLFAGAVFGLANVFLKPLLTFIAIPLIIITFGIAYFFVNVAILAFTEWVVPNFSIDGFWTYVGAVIVMWLVNVALGRLLCVRSRVTPSATRRGLAELDEERARGHLVAGRDVNGGHVRREGCDDRHLHLHRLEHHERLPRRRDIPRRDVHADHRARHRRRNRAVPDCVGGG